MNKRFQVKIFKSGDGFKYLQNQINNWLDDPMDVTKYLGFELVDIKYQDNNSYASALVIFSFTGIVAKAPAQASNEKGDGTGG